MQGHQDKLQEEEDGHQRTSPSGAVKTPHETMSAKHKTNELVTWKFFIFV